LTGAGAGQQSIVQVTGGGTISLGGATLAVTLEFAPTAGVPITIIDNLAGTPVQGAFATSTVTASYADNSYTFAVSKTGGAGNSVTLSPIPQGTVMFLR
jgi:hypothetical protein